MKYVVKINGVTYEAEVEEVGGQAPVQAAPVAAKAPVQAAPKAAAAAPQGAAGGQTISAPMPGTVLKLNVKAGDSLKKGDVVIVLEAMKMEPSLE